MYEIDVLKAGEATVTFIMYKQGRGGRTANTVLIPTVNDCSVALVQRNRSIARSWKAKESSLD